MPALDWRIIPARSISRCETICASLGFSRSSGRKYSLRRINFTRETRWANSRQDNPTCPSSRPGSGTMTSAAEFPSSHPRLAGKIALITGASRGIGAAVAERFAREDAHLVLAARTVGGLEEVDDAVRAVGGSATLVPLDLREFVKIDELAAALFDRYGRLDVLIGNAAEFGTFSPLGHIHPGTWAEVVDLNLTANWR